MSSHLTISKGNKQTTPMQWESCPTDYIFDIKKLSYEADGYRHESWVTDQAG